MKLNFEAINNFFGDMDLFLMDLLLKGHIESGKLLDVGFGTGRNLIHFLQQENFDVYGVETDKSTISLVQLMLAGFNNQNPDRFIHASVTEMPFESNFFQTVICARVFHFLKADEKQKAWEAIHRVLKPGGLLYLSSNSSVNFETRVHADEKGKSVFPDGTSGYVLSAGELNSFLGDPRFKKIESVRHIQHDDEHAETILSLRKC